MPSKVPCYLRTLRREAGLTQEELANLVPGCRKARVSAVERGNAIPNATELLAYSFIFGRPPQAIFSRYVEEIEDAAMRSALRLHEQLESDASPRARQKSEFLGQIHAGASLGAHDSDS